MPLNILYVITKANWGGAQRYVYDLATAAKAAGHTVRVVTGPAGILTKKLEEADIEVVSLPSLKRDVSLGSEWGVFQDLRAEILDFAPDIVHGNSSKAGALAALAARTIGSARVLFTGHGWAFNEDRPWWQKAVIWLIHYATVLLTDRTICVSEAARHDTRFMPFVREKVMVIHNGVPPIDLLPRDEARRRLAPVLSPPFWIGTIAEHHPTKQLHVLLRAFKDVAAVHPDTALVLMGDGQERERLERYAKRLQLADRVVFCGHVDEASRHLAALDLFVLPSRSEGLAYVLIEAGRAGLPVVASRVGGIPEVVENGVSGVLVRPGSSHLLAVALEALIADPELRRRYGSNLRLRAEEKFSLERMVTKTLALYKSLLIHR